jgi:glutaredoxin
MVVIYGKPMCSACDTAKRELTKRGVDFEYKELNKDYSIVKFYEIAPRTHKTFPMLTLDGVYVGTFADLCEKLNK